MSRGVLGDVSGVPRRLGRGSLVLVSHGVSRVIFWGGGGGGGVISLTVRRSCSSPWRTGLF